MFSIVAQMLVLDACILHGDSITNLQGEAF